jgi:hypothetical protein
MRSLSIEQALKDRLQRADVAIDEAVLIREDATDVRRMEAICSQQDINKLMAVFGLGRCSAALLQREFGNSIDSFTCHIFA